MAYTYDDYGNIQRIGINLSHVGMNMPQRSGGFSAAYAFGGLFAGGTAGFMVSLLVKMIAAAVSFNADAPNASPLSIFEILFTSEFVFTGGVFTVAIIFAIIGFFWDGIEATADMFLVSMASLGLILGMLIGLIPAIIIAALLSVAFSISDMTAMGIILFFLSVFAIGGFFWNGIEHFRDSFSITRAFLGGLCGLIKGVLKCLALFLGHGCFVIILAAVFSPIATAAAAIIILFYICKGFFIVGSGGDWYNI